jgi:DNA-binding transcriptional LysR family regulator
MDTPFELRTLRYFVAVASDLHFGRAAARLHIAQPSLSVQIQKLERSLGVPLFERTSRRVVLTGAGEVLLAEARALLEEADRIVTATRDAGHRDRRPITVGFQANAAAELTPRILALFAQRYPLRRIEMKSHDLTDPFVGLSDGSVDAAFVRTAFPAPGWLSTKVLFSEPRVLAVSTDSPLAGAGPVSMEELVDLPFCARKGPDAWRDFWVAAGSRGGHPVRIGASVAQLDECMEAVISGRAIAFTPVSTLRYYARPGLTTIPVVDIPPSEVVIAWRTDDPSELVRDFVETARAVAATTRVPQALDRVGSYPTADARRPARDVAFGTSLQAATARATATKLRTS